MDYELKAISDTDISWSPVMEAWWNNGGALLWNRFGGFGKNQLVLEEEEVKSFLQEAGEIAGWHSGDSEDYCAALGNPILVRPYSVNECPAEQEDQHSDEPQNWCCRECGRSLHEGLDSADNMAIIAVSRRDLNHVLNSLREAIDFSRSNGPNNNLTWEASLEAIVASLKQLRHS
jgi:hypothetical protein